MFRQTDKDEELKRLEQELLRTENPPEEYLDPAAIEDAPTGEAPEVYRNFSNNYGKDLRNFASGYQDYQEDGGEEPPEQPQNRGALIFVLILAAVVAVAAVALLLRFGGYF